MKNTWVFISCLLWLACSNQSNTKNTALIFQRGERITNNNFQGETWLNTLVEADSINDNSVGSVTFAPGARTNWHLHPKGQIILALDGVGYYQEQGSAKRFLHKGDVVKCPANIPHWHGASADSPFVQVAITSREGGGTKWLQPVTEKEYKE